jgi:hypothetical protein
LALLILFAPSVALPLTGQLKLFKNTPDIFVFAPSVALPLTGQLKLFKNTPDVFVFAPSVALDRPADRATGAQPDIAKLLAMFYPASP